MKTLMMAASAAVMTITSATAGEWEDSALKQLRTSIPQVVDIQWGQPGSLWLFVMDNGQNRDGLATSACGALSFVEGTPQRRNVVVRVWDAASVTKDNMRGIGYARCSLKP
ncbi:hypothetical protein [Aureimonas ureilytica]|uniref:hypothetical protein n=1 Tax=Aureimonas ureilytica TaxID=401562 RepID=UPI0012E33034|nr:hypothetical protein [Aureimonas ureilytica]